MNKQKQMDEQNKQIKFLKNKQINKMGINKERKKIRKSGWMNGFIYFTIKYLEQHLIIQIQEVKCKCK